MAVSARLRTACRLDCDTCGLAGDLVPRETGFALAWRALVVFGVPLLVALIAAVTVTGRDAQAAAVGGGLVAGGLLSRWLFGFCTRTRREGP